jgi:hypothetical protein
MLISLLASYLKKFSKTNGFLRTIALISPDYNFLQALVVKQDLRKLKEEIQLSGLIYQTNLIMSIFILIYLRCANYACAGRRFLSTTGEEETRLSIALSQFYVRVGSKPQRRDLTAGETNRQVTPAYGGLRPAGTSDEEKVCKPPSRAIN